MENLGGILLRFRIPLLVIACDIEKAVLQVAVHESDRDAACFLWLRDPFSPEFEKNLVTYLFTRVAFGLIYSPFLLTFLLFAMY